MSASHKAVLARQAESRAQAAAAAEYNYWYGAGYSASTGGYPAGAGSYYSSGDPKKYYGSAPKSYYGTRVVRVSLQFIRAASWHLPQAASQS